MDEGDESKSNEIRESETRGTRPGFLRGTDEYEAPQSLTRDVNDLTPKNRADKKTDQAERRNDAADGLKSAEEQAAKGGFYKSGVEDNLDGTREAEEVGGLYRSSDKGFLKGTAKGGMRGALKKKGPFIAILLSILGFGGAMSTMQLFQPFSIVAQMQEAFNSMHISANERSSRIIRWQLNKNGIKDPVVSKFGGKNTLKITKKQQENLKKQGIEYKEDYDDGSGNKVRALIYDTGEVDADGKAITKVVTGDNFDSVYANDTKFHSAYNSGSRTWRGQFANWFGSKTVDFITTNKLTRNLFQNFRTKVDENPNKSTMDVLKDLLYEKIGKNDSSGGVRGREKPEEGEIEDEDGNKKKAYKLAESTEEEVSVKDMQTESGVRAKLDSIAKKSAQLTNIGCGVLQLVGTISALVAAAEALQIINITSAVFEAADKTKAEKGDESPIMEFGEALNEKVVNKNYTLEGAGSSAKYVEEDPRERSAMESEGVSALYERRLANAADPSLNSFNITGRIQGFFGGLGVSMASFKACNLAKSVASVVSMIKDGIEVWGCVTGILATPFTFGASAAACGPLAMDIAIGIVVNVALAAILTAVIGFLTPIVVQAFTRDLVTDLAGEDLGNAIVSGGNMYQGSVHRSNGGSAATEKEYTKYAAAQTKVIADNARYERESLSPFDITSKNTFMGTLMTELMALTTTSGTLMDTITTGGAVMSNSIADINQTVSAAADIKMEIPKNYEEVCPALASIGVVGDQFCNPYVITDVGTMDAQMSEVIDKVYEYGGITGGSDDENVSVVEGSKLAKYIDYCGDRQSPLGMTDYNIANSVDGAVGTASGNAIIGALPVIGDGIDIASNTIQSANAGWISGESCVAGNDVSGLDMSPDWEETQWYQRFIEDQSLAESMGLIEESAVSKYKEASAAVNPEDETYAGMLSRYSGLTEETIADVVDFMWYADYIANYDPSERYAFVETEEPEEIKFDNENVLASGKQAIENIVYFDLRNRNYVA